jgi:hypothetical protein
MVYMVVGEGCNGVVAMIISLLKAELDTVVACRYSGLEEVLGQKLVLLVEIIGRTLIKQSVKLNYACGGFWIEAEFSNRIPIG